MEIGNVVYSKQGRDKDRCYLVVAAADRQGYWMVVDGDVRTLTKPKCKNQRHLAYNGERVENIAAKLAEGKQVFDSEIKSALRQYVK